MSPILDSARFVPTGKLLLVDDDRFYRKFALHFLQEGAHGAGVNLAIDEAEDGQHAAEFLAQKFYDILVTDGVMPRRDGLWLLEALSSDFRGRVKHAVYHSGTASEHRDPLMTHFEASSHPLRGVLHKGSIPEMCRLQAVPGLIHPEYSDRIIDELAASTRSFFERVGKI